MPSNDLVSTGRHDEAKAYAPRQQSSSDDELGPIAYLENDSGQFELDSRAEGGLGIRVSGDTDPMAVVSSLCEVAG